MVIPRKTTNVCSWGELIQSTSEKCVWTGKEHCDCKVCSVFTGKSMSEKCVWTGKEHCDCKICSVFTGKSMSEKCVWTGKERCDCEVCSRWDMLAKRAQEERASEQPAPLPPPPAQEPEKCKCKSDMSQCAVCTREYLAYHAKVEQERAEKATMNAYFREQDRLERDWSLKQANKSSLG
jgi:hypothetical protein